MDISCLNASVGDSTKANIDTALKVRYSPQSVKQLLVTTANNKLIKFDARNGKMIAEVINGVPVFIHLYTGTLINPPSMNKLFSFSNSY